MALPDTARSTAAPQRAQPPPSTARRLDYGVPMQLPLAHATAPPRPARAAPAVLDLLAPPAGPNTNVSNSRFVPITTATDVLEVTNIVGTGGPSASTGAPQFVGHYPNSYNMTPEALHNRTTNVQGGRNFIVQSQQPSVYDPNGRNIDVVWGPIGEPASNFPPAMIQAFTRGPDNSRAARAAARCDERRTLRADVA